MAMRVNSTPVDRPFLVFAVTASESLGRRPSGRQAMQRFGADTWNTTEIHTISYASPPPRVLDPPLCLVLVLVLVLQAFPTSVSV